MNRILDRLLTVLMLALLGWAGFSAVHWLLFSADWSVVTNNLPLYALGGYPLDQRWRPLVWIALLIVMTAVTLVGPRQGWLRQGLPALWSLMVPLGVVLLAGGLGLQPVPTRAWGGFSLTLLLTVCSTWLSVNCLLQREAWLLVPPRWRITERVAVVELRSRRCIRGLTRRHRIFSTNFHENFRDRLLRNPALPRSAPWKITICSITNAAIS